VAAVGANSTAYEELAVAGLPPAPTAKIALGSGVRGTEAARAEENESVTTSSLEGVGFPAASQNESTAKNMSEGASSASVETETSAASTVLRLYKLGQSSLKNSDCYKAQHWFSAALKMLHQVDLPDPGQYEGAGGDLLGNLAFSLICAQRYTEGLELLEGCVTGELECASHLLNALGFGLFQMKDYKTAARAFLSGAEKDSLNPIIWNNLGAARMVLWDLEGADEAMVRVAELTEDGKDPVRLSPHHQEVFVRNVEELKRRAETYQASDVLPRVELWFGDDDGWKGGGAVGDSR